MKILSFDIELYNDYVDGMNLFDLIPSVAGISTGGNVSYYYDLPHMSRDTAKTLVDDIFALYEDGYIPFGWNTTKFDFALLGAYSGKMEECAELAMNGIDGMLMVTFNKGYYLSLNSALLGAGLAGKTKAVALKDGSILTEMSGEIAPKLWRHGETKAVIQYLEGDVLEPIKLAEIIEEHGGIRWISKTGHMMFCQQPLAPVKDLLSIPEPNTSWMSSKPKGRDEFFAWMPPKVLEKYGIKLKGE